MAAKLDVADEFLLRQIDRWRRLIVPHRWQMVATGMATSVVVPAGRGFQDVIEMCCRTYARAAERSSQVSNRVGAMRGFALLGLRPTSSSAAPE